MKNKTAVKNKAANIVIAALILLIGLCCMVLKAEGKDAQQNTRFDEKKYDAMEREYCERISEILIRYGLRGGGVNLTKITEKDGARHYKLEIYHARIAKMDETQRKDLEREIGRLRFSDGNCRVSVKFGCPD